MDIERKKIFIWNERKDLELREIHITKFLDKLKKDLDEIFGTLLINGSVDYVLINYKIEGLK